MKKYIFLIALLLLPPYADAAWYQVNSFPYSTSAASCSEWTQPASGVYPAEGGITGCDNVNSFGDWYCSSSIPNKGWQITADANYPSGEGGLGFRFYYGDTNNNGSGGPDFRFATAQPNLWTRYYARWQAGFDQNSVNHLYQKMIYMYEAMSGGFSVIMDTLENQCLFTIQAGYPGNTEHWTNNPACGSHAVGFNDNGIGDGSWHLFESHFQMNTSGNYDGVFEWWIDGVQVYNRTNLGYKSDGTGGIVWIKIPSNNKTLNNGACASFDIDDIAFSTTGRIGPYGAGAGDSTPGAFAFTNQTDVALGSTGNSDNATLTGFDNTTTLVLSGDASCKYSINGAAWATADDNVSVNDNVALQNAASGSHGTSVECTLTVGGVINTDAPWSRMTLSAVVDTDTPKSRFGGRGGWR